MTTKDRSPKKATTAPRKRASAQPVEATPVANPLRAQAEAAMRARPAPKAPAPGGDRMLHELQVHQIELEMQNEQLRQSNDELSRLHARYLDLYDFAPVAYFTVGSDRRLVELNLTAARLLGRERGTLLGKRLSESVHASAREAYEHLVSRALLRDELVEEALVLAPGSAGPVYVKAQARRFEDAEGRSSARIVMMDLSALKSANEELARALENFFRYWRP